MKLEIPIELILLIAMFCPYDIKFDGNNMKLTMEEIEIIASWLVKVFALENKQNYALKSEFGWSDLYFLIDSLNNYPDSINNLLNVNRILWMHAINYCLINFDSYIGYAQNYYLYYRNLFFRRRILILLFVLNCYSIH